MIIFLAVALVLMLIGAKRQSKNEKNTFLDRDQTLAINGMFVILIVFSHFFSYLPLNTLNVLDTPARDITAVGLGQLIVTTFLFYSGYGIFESFKAKGDKYASSYMKNRVLRIYLSFVAALILFVALDLILKEPYSIEEYLLSFTGFVPIGNSNWYVVVIIFLYTLSLISYKICGLNKKALMISHFILCLFLILAMDRGGLGSYWWNTIPAYFYGVCLSLYKDKVVNLLGKNKYSKFIFLGCSLLLFALFDYVLPAFVIRLNVFYFLAILFFLLSILSLTYIVQIKNKMLIWAGKNSFWIYILQRLPMLALAKIPGFATTNLRYVFFVLSVILTIGLALGVGQGFDKLWTLVNKKPKK